MDDGAPALKRGPEVQADPPRQPALKWSREPYHRRRRATALLALIALAASVAIPVFVGGGGIAHPRTARPTAVFFSRLETLTAASSFAAEENAAIDRTLAYTPYVRVAGAQHRELALTFDDGPGPYTPSILSILERDKVPATFFEVGVLERYFNASTSAIIADGDVIGDHTFFHAPMGRLSRSDQRAELLQDARVLQLYGAPFPRLFRPPYGLWNAATLALLRKYRMLMVLWSVDTADYRQAGVRGIVQSVVAGARPGAIILLHDAGGNRSETVAALPAIIARLRARGYQLVTVPKLLLDNPAPHNQQISSVIGNGG